MILKNSPLLLFIIKVFLCLPGGYYLWYFCAERSTSIVIYLTEPLLQALLPRLIASIEQQTYLIDVVFNVTVTHGHSVKAAEMLIPVNPLIYSYGSPLALALILASRLKLLRILVT